MNHFVCWGLRTILVISLREKYEVWRVNALRVSHAECVRLERAVRAVEKFCLKAPLWAHAWLFQMVGEFLLTLSAGRTASRCAPRVK